MPITAPSAGPRCRRNRPPPRSRRGRPRPQYGRDAAADDAAVPALSSWATLGALLLFAVPVAGFLFSLAWSFGFTKNPARRRLAQAYLIRTLLVAVVAALLLFWVAVSSVLTLSVTPYPYY